MRAPSGTFTPEEADQARAFLREHGSPVQKQLDKDDEGLFLIVDYLDEEEAAERSERTGSHVEPGEEVMFVTDNDELIVDYWRYLKSLPAAELKAHVESLMVGLPDGAHRNN